MRRRLLEIVEEDGRVYAIFPDVLTPTEISQSTAVAVRGGDLADAVRRCSCLAAAALSALECIRAMPLDGREKLAGCDLVVEESPNDRAPKGRS